MILLFLEKVQIDYTGIMSHMQVALYHTPNPSDFIRHNNDCVKPCIARPVCLHNICFCRPAQTHCLGFSNCTYSGGYVWTIFNLYKQHQIPTPRDNVNFGAPSITPGHVPGFYNTKPMQTQIHPRNKFRNQTCFIRIHSRTII